MGAASVDSGISDPGRWGQHRCRVADNEDQDPFAMEGLLTSSVASNNGVDWIGVPYGYWTSSSWLFADTWARLLHHNEIGVRALQFVQGPWTSVHGSHATSTARIRLTLDHPASWFNDWRVRLIVEDTYPVEDIYPVRLELDRVGLDWRISYFELYQGERQTAFVNAWTTFAQGFYDENADTMLSVCANPFYWTGIPEFTDVGTRDEWLELLPEFFAVATTDLMSLTRVTPIQLSSGAGAFRIEIHTGSKLFHAEATMRHDGGKWLLSGVHFASIP